MSALEHLQSQLDKALKWLVLELARYERLEEHWKSLKSKAEEIILIERTNVLKRDIKFVGHAERRFNKYKTHLSSEMVAFIDHVPEVNAELGGIHYVTINVVFNIIKEELKRIDIEAANLLVDSSCHSSKLHDCWEHIHTALQEHDIHRIEAAIVEMGLTIEDGKKWIRALTVDLSSIKDRDLPQIERELEFKSMVKAKLPVLADFEGVMIHFKEADDLLEETVLKRGSEEVLEKIAPGNNRDPTIKVEGLSDLKLRRKSDFNKFKKHLVSARKILEGIIAECKQITAWLHKMYISLELKEKYYKELKFLNSCQSITQDVFELITSFLESIRVNLDSQLVFNEEGAKKISTTNIFIISSTSRGGYKSLGHFWEGYHHYRKRAAASFELQVLYFIFGETSKILRYSYPFFHHFEKQFLE